MKNYFQDSGWYVLESEIGLQLLGSSEASEQLETDSYFIQIQDGQPEFFSVTDGGLKPGPLELPLVKEVEDLCSSLEKLKENSDRALQLINELDELRLNSL